MVSGLLCACLGVKGRRFPDAKKFSLYLLAAWHLVTVHLKSQCSVLAAVYNCSVWALPAVFLLELVALVVIKENSKYFKERLMWICDAVTINSLTPTQIHSSHRLCFQFLFCTSPPTSSSPPPLKSHACTFPRSQRTDVFICTVPGCDSWFCCFLKHWASYLSDTLYVKFCSCKTSRGWCWENKYGSGWLYTKIAVMVVKFKHQAVCLLC